MERPRWGYTDKEPDYAVKWWSHGNTLALVEAMEKFAFGKSEPDLEAALNGGLVGVARQIGMSEDDIRDAFESDRMLTIYEP